VGDKKEMNTNLPTIVKQISSEYGEAVIADPARLKAFFSDIAKDEPKPLRIAFGRCIEARAYAALETAPDASERAERKALIVQKAHDEHGLDKGLYNEALDILEAALYADRKEPIRYVSCGKELQPEWKLCPFCGATVRQKESATQQELPPTRVSEQSALRKENKTLSVRVWNAEHKQLIRTIFRRKSGVNGVQPGRVAHRLSFVG
jgi:rubrerythrin